MIVSTVDPTCWLYLSDLLLICEFRSIRKAQYLELQFFGKTNCVILLTGDIKCKKTTAKKRHCKKY